ncbi:MAG: lmo0937 family membrane protein [Acidobacteria bacterium]|nr:lmo0937 family membrane protein [Acidobacteriota bacterium]
MLWTIVIILLVLWALGFGFGALGNIVHLLLVVAVVMVVVQLIQRRGA